MTISLTRAELRELKIAMYEREELLAQMKMYVPVAFKSAREKLNKQTA